MATITMKDCEKAVTMSKAGKKLPEIMKMTGLNYSQAWGAIESANLPKSELVPESGRTATKVAQLRDAKRLSWGAIMVRFGWHPANPGIFTHGKIRRLYKEATGLHSEGLRIGHGGRFLLGDLGINLYRGGNRKREGLQIDSNLSRAEILERVGKELDTNLAKLTASGKITRSQAEIRKANAMKQAGKAVDNAKASASPVKKAVKKAPASKKATATPVAKKTTAKPSKKAIAAMKKASNGHNAAEMRAQAREAASVGAE